MQAKPSIMQRIGARETSVNWSLLTALFFIIAYIVLWIAGQSIVITLSGESFTQFSPGTLVLGAALGNIAVTLVALLWARRRFQANWQDELRIRQPIWLPIFFMILVGLAAAWATDLIGVLLRLKGDQILPPILAALREPIGVAWVAAAVFAVVIQPVAEGVIFYGIVYPALARDLNHNIMAAVLIALIYTGINAAILNSGTVNWYLFIQPFLMALVIALIRAYSQSTISAVVARAMFGLFFVLAALISIR